MEANFRFDLARIREYSEQIALLKGEEREIGRAGTVFEDVFTTIQRIIRVRTWLAMFTTFYSQISIIIPYVVVAPYYFLKKVSFGEFNQAADAFSNVNTSMNFFVDRYVGLADFSATVNRLTSFDEAFERALARDRGPAATSSPNPRPARRSRSPNSSSRCPTDASWRGSAISCWCRRNRRWSWAPAAPANRRCSAPSPACGRSARAKSCSRPTPS